MPAGLPQHADIDVVKTLPFSDFVLTGSKEFGSINVWSTKLGMHMLGGFNFYDDYFKAKASDKQVKFKLTQLKERTEANVTLHLRRAVGEKGTSTAD